MGGAEGGGGQERAPGAVAVPAAEAAGHGGRGPCRHGGAAGRHRQVRVMCVMCHAAPPQLPPSCGNAVMRHTSFPRAYLPHICHVYTALSTWWSSRMAPADVCPKLCLRQCRQTAHLFATCIPPKCSPQVGTCIVRCESKGWQHPADTCDITTRRSSSHTCHCSAKSCSEACLNQSPVSRFPPRASSEGALCRRSSHASMRFCA